jgi:para-nitrobenzyl esterase
MVWIHGGGFETGSAGNPLADAAQLAARGDVVVVSLQYRIGILGFLDVPGAAPNRGLLDLVAGLAWVEENVAAFGGDPEEVTLFGASAGGVCVATLLAVPEVRARVKRAIVQSGSAECFHSASVAAAVRAEVGRELGVPADGDRLRDELSQLDTEALLALQQRVGARLEAETGSLVFAPVLGSEPLVAHPLTSLSRGAAQGIPLLVGTNRDEMKLVALRSFPLAPRPLRESELREKVDELLGGSCRLADEALRLYRGLERLRGATTNDVLHAIATDFHFRAPAARLADAHVRREPRTYAYLFSFPAPQLGPLIGTPHAMEIPMLFGTYGVPPMPLFLGNGPKLEVISRKMQDMWIAFARTGDPSTDETGPWPSHTPVRREAIVIDEKVRVERILPDAEMSFWAEAFAALRPVMRVDIAVASFGPPARTASIMPPHLDA